MSNMQNEDGKMIKVGVLAIQGAVAEHLELLNQIPDVCAQEVKYLDELNEIDGLIYFLTMQGFQKDEKQPNIYYFEE